MTRLTVSDNIITMRLCDVAQAQKMYCKEITQHTHDWHLTKET
jgi:hypothetical protein